MEIVSAEGGKYIRMALLDENTNWNLKIFNALTGKNVVDRNIQGVSGFIDTSGWKSGAYVVKCQVGDKVVTEKMFVKQ